MIMIGVIVIVMAMAMAIYDNTPEMLKLWQCHSIASLLGFASLVKQHWIYPIWLEVSRLWKSVFLGSNSFCDSLSGIFLLMMICRWNFPSNKILPWSSNIHLFAPMQCWGCYDVDFICLLNVGHISQMLKLFSWSGNYHAVIDDILWLYVLYQNGRIWPPHLCIVCFIPFLVIMIRCWR